MGGLKNTQTDPSLEAALLSHQLRNPLSAIKWFTESLLDEDVGELTAEQRIYLERIHENYRHSADLINELVVGLAEAGRPEVTI